MSAEITFPCTDDEHNKYFLVFSITCVDGSRLALQGPNPVHRSAALKNLTRVAIAAAFAVSTSALADTITVQFDNPIYAHGSDTISITSSAAPPNPYAVPGPGAGEFGATVTNYTGALTGASFVDSQSDFFLYCYDLLQSISQGGKYTYTVNYGGALGRTLNFLGAVNYVLSGNSNTWSDPYAWLHPASESISAAIQIGIWESLYDDPSKGGDGAWSLTTGHFQASGLNGGTLTDYNSFIAALGSSNSAAQNQTMVLENDRNQDQITGLRPPRFDTPEPGTLALIATGLIAGGIARRKRKA
jgi:hypothetical protein